MASTSRRKSVGYIERIEATLAFCEGNKNYDQFDWLHCFGGYAVELFGNQPEREDYRARALDNRGGFRSPGIVAERVLGLSMSEASALLYRPSDFDEMKVIVLEILTAHNKEKSDEDGNGTGSTSPVAGADGAGRGRPKKNHTKIRQSPKWG